VIDVLRRHRQPVTAARLAGDLGVSERTIYRDIQALLTLGATIVGEAGVGYVLRPGFFLPPLVFDENEFEAIVLGARWVEQQGDETLRAAAANAVSKIVAASRRDLRDRLNDTGLWANAGPKATAVPALRPLREAIRRERKLRITYLDEHGVASERTIWPIALGFGDRIHLLAAWCELRAGFRHFRVDRITGLDETGERYPKSRNALVSDWLREMNFPDTRS
jgi:predicted DNA-binding transcriptional regulator YafY